MTPPTADLLEAPPRETSDTDRPSTAPTAPTAAPASTTAPAEPAEPEPKRPKKERSGARVAARGLWASFKFLVLLAVIGGLVVAAVVGWPYLRDRVYEDVDANAAQIETLDAQLADANATIADLEARLDELGQRQDEVPTRLDDLAAGQTALATEQDAAAAGIDALEGRSGSLEQETADLAVRVDDADAATARLAGELHNQLEIARATELLSRARLFLYQANYGLAIQDLTVAQAILVGIDPASGGISPEVHAAATDRIAMTIASLPDRPVLAADDLDIAWQMLVADPDSPLVASNPPIPVTAPADPAAESTADTDAGDASSTGSTDGTGDAGDTDEDTTDGS